MALADNKGNNLEVFVIEYTQIKHLTVEGQPPIIIYLAQVPMEGIDEDFYVHRNPDGKIEVSEAHQADLPAEIRTQFDSAVDEYRKSHPKTEKARTAHK